MAEQENAHALRVGIVMIIGIAILATAIFSIGGGLRFLRGTRELTMHFQHINELRPGAPVYLSGVNIGSVSSVQFPGDRRANYVIVRASIDGNALARVRTDSVAKIESLGLLGDKFLLLTTGSPDAPSADPNALLKTQDPLNYQSLLQARGTGDLVANVIAISSSLREIMETFNQGNGLLAQLIKGSSDPNERLTLASFTRALNSIQTLTNRLDLTVDRVNHGQGVIGEMLSPETNGRRVVTNIADAADSLRSASARLDQTSIELGDLVGRINHANGLLPQLVEDQKYAGEVMSNLRRSSNDMLEVMDKINSRQGTLGLMVNDPTLYNNATNLVGASGWGFSLLKGMYSLSHPFGTTASPSYAPATTDTLRYAPDLGSGPPATGKNSAPPYGSQPN
jgi:phospholipid/cholesterol/gamma-HCH transport system substrate-binding protein